MMTGIRRVVLIGVTALFLLAACLAGCKSGGQGVEDSKVSAEEASSKAKAMLMKGPGAGGGGSDEGASKAKEMLTKGPGAGD